MTALGIGIGPSWNILPSALSSRRSGPPTDGLVFQLRPDRLVYQDEAGSTPALLHGATVLNWTSSVEAEDVAFTQADSGKKLTLGLGGDEGLPYLTPGGTGYLEAGDLSALFPGEMTLIAMFDPLTDDYYSIYSCNSRAAGFVDVWRYTDGNVYASPGRTDRADAIVSGIAATAGLREYRWTSTASKYTLHIDGVLAASTSPQYNAGNQHRVAYFEAAFPDMGYTGRIYDIFAYNADLDENAALLLEVENYLANRYRHREVSARTQTFRIGFEGEYSPDAVDEVDGKPAAPHRIESASVDPSGNLLVLSPYNEEGMEAQHLRLGQLVSAGGLTHGFEKTTGLAVHAGESRGYYATALTYRGPDYGIPGLYPPDADTVWYGVSVQQGPVTGRFDRPHTFPGGVGQYPPIEQNNILVVAETTDASPYSTWNHVRGIAESGGVLFVADPISDTIKKYDLAADFAALGSLPISGAGVMCPDGDDGFWVARSTTVIERYDADGLLLATVTLSGGSRLPEAGFELSTDPLVPTGIGLDWSTGNLLVCDGGPNQQIRIYDPDGDFVGTFGTTGGYLAGPTPGILGELRFRGPVGVGAGADGVIQVVQKSVVGAWTEGYSGSTRLWRTGTTAWISSGVSEIAGDGVVDVYTSVDRVRFNWKTGEQTVEAATLDEINYPEDPRRFAAASPTDLATLGGKRYLLTADQTGGYACSHLLAAGTEIGKTRTLMFGQKPAVPTKNMSQEWFDSQTDDAGQSLWTSASADAVPAEGEWVGVSAPGHGDTRLDASGNIWRAIGRDINGRSEIQRIEFTGLNAHDTPVWDFAGREALTLPEGFYTCYRAQYVESTDTLYVAGTVGDHVRDQSSTGTWYARIDDYYVGANRTPTWMVELPRGPEYWACPFAFDLAGDYLFVAYGESSATMGWGRGRVLVVRASNGSIVEAIEPDPAIGVVGLMDSTSCIRAMALPDGSYLYWLEEDRVGYAVGVRWVPPTS